MAWSGPIAAGTLAVTVQQTDEASFIGDTTLSALTHELNWRSSPWSINGFDAAVGFDYEYTRFEYTALNTRNRDLHRLQVPLRLSSSSGEWAWEVDVAPGIATSSNVMKDVLRRGRREDLFATGGMTFRRPVGPVELLAGFRHDRRFGRSRGYPIVAIQGEDNEWRWQLGAPDAWIDYAFSDNTRLRLAAGPSGMQWHTVRDDFASDFEYRVRRWQVGVIWEQRLIGPVWAQFQAARVVDRQHRLELADRAGVVGGVDDDWMLGITLRLGAPTRRTGYRVSW